MSTIFEQLGRELAELQRYRAMYGNLDAHAEDEHQPDETPTEGSDTEQE
jgi:hypothetical protein